MLLVAPLAIVVVFSFGERGHDGGLRAGVHARQLRQAISRSPDPFDHEPDARRRSGPACACWSASRWPTSSRPAAGSRKGLFIILLVIPFWTSFLIRTYAWLMILGPDGHRRVRRQTPPATTVPDPRARRSRVLLGLVYGYLPLMVFPLYVTLERMDRTLRRGVQGPRRRPMGDVPPGHPADHPARAHHRQHPRVHPDDGRVRDPVDPGLRPGVHDGQLARAAVPRGAQLAVRLGAGRRADRS